MPGARGVRADAGRAPWPYAFRMAHKQPAAAEQSEASGEASCCGGSASSGGGCCQGESKAKGGARAGGCCKEDPDKRMTMNGIMGQMAKDLSRPMGWEEMATLPVLHLVMRYRKGVQNLDNRVLQLSERQIDQAFLPEANVGRWPVRVLLGHLADAEVFYAGRMRRCVGEANPVVEVWDEDSFVDENVYLNGPKEYAHGDEADHTRVLSAVGGHMAVIHTLRQWLGQWLLALDDSAWDRAFMHPQRGAVTLRQAVALSTWHLEHHGAFLTKKLDLMLGPAPAEKPAAGGCCGGH